MKPFLTSAEFRGQEFTPEEIMQANDFADVIRIYSYNEEDLKDFLDEKDIKTGHKIYLAEKMPIDDLGILLLSEEDERIIKIAQNRCDEEFKTNDGIFLI